MRNYYSDATKEHHNAVHTHFHVHHKSEVDASHFGGDCIVYHTYLDIDTLVCLGWYSLGQYNHMLQNPKKAGYYFAVTELCEDGSLNVREDACNHVDAIGPAPKLIEGSVRV